MPVAKIHVLEGHYGEARLGKAVQGALIGTLGVPPEDFFQIIHVLPRGRHTPSFLGLTYSDGLILLDITFIPAPQGKAARVAQGPQRCRHRRRGNLA
jgi:4-oxalocrotonate tautomerase